MFRRLTLPALLLFAAIATFAVPREAQAAPDPVSVAPFAGHCFDEAGSTCVVPDLSFNVYRVKLNGSNAGKMDVGAVPVGLGYALLFGYDQWWASGVALHGILDLSQSDANKYEVSATATVLRYGHAGVAVSRADAFTQFYLVAGLSVPIDVITTGLQQQKAQAARLARAAPQI